MSKVRLNGSTSGYTEIVAAATAGNNEIKLPATGAGSLIATSDTGTVSTAMLADSSVATAKLADGAITAAKLNTSASAGVGVGYVEEAGSNYVIWRAANGTKICQCWGTGTGGNTQAGAFISFGRTFSSAPHVSVGVVASDASKISGNMVSIGTTGFNYATWWESGSNTARNAYSCTWTAIGPVA